MTEPAIEVEGLRKAYGSFEAVRDARPDELIKVRGIGPGLAARITDSLSASISSGSRP